MPNSKHWELSKIEDTSLFPVIKFSVNADCNNTNTMGFMHQWKGLYVNAQRWFSKMLLPLRDDFGRGTFLGTTFSS